MDLMIHDLDLILSLDRSDVTQVTGSGVSLLGTHEDLAEARIHFASGLVVNIRASRLAASATRRMKLFTTSGYADVDFSSDQVQVVKPSAEVVARSIALDQLTHAERMQAKATILQDLFVPQAYEAPGRNAILDEQNDFALSIQSNCEPVVSGHAGARAVDLAGKIVTAIQQHRWEGEHSKEWQIGPLATLSPVILPHPATVQSAELPEEKNGQRKAG